MENNNLVEIIRSQQMFADMSESEKQQAKEDLAKIQGKMKKTVSKVQVTVKSLRKAADKLDKVWNDCKIAHVSGKSAEIAGGILTIFGGILTILTAGAATPVLIAGIAVGAAGASTNLGTAIAEAVINSKEIKKAEKDLKETLDCINNVKNTVQLWLDRKDKARLLYIFCLAIRTLELSDPVIKLLQPVISSVTNIPVELVEAATRFSMDVGRVGGKAAEEAAQTGAQAGQAAGKVGAQDVAESGAKASAKAGAKVAGGVIIGVSAVFLVWDAIDLGFSIRDLVKDKGSEAAKFLREKADELEELC